MQGETLITDVVYYICMSDLVNLKHRLRGELDASPVLRYSTDGEERLKVVGGGTVNLKIVDAGRGFVITGEVSEDWDDVHYEADGYDDAARFIKEEVFVER